MAHLSTRALAARARAAKRWYVYLILCRGGAIYTGIARNVAVRYAQHVAGTGARYTRANPPARLLVRFACLNQSEPAEWRRRSSNWPRSISGNWWARVVPLCGNYYSVDQLSDTPPGRNTTIPCLQSISKGQHRLRVSQSALGKVTRLCRFASKANGEFICRTHLTGEGRSSSPQ